MKSFKTQRNYIHILILILVSYAILMTPQCHARTTATSHMTAATATTTATDIERDNPSTSHMVESGSNLPQFMMMYYQKDDNHHHPYYHDDDSRLYCKNHRYTSTISTTNPNTNDVPYDGGIMVLQTNPQTGQPQQDQQEHEQPNYILVNDSKTRHWIRSVSKWFTLGFSMLKVFTALYDDQNGDLDKQ